MRFLVVMIVLIILGLLLERIINKLLGIDKKGKVSETSGKNIDRWGRGIIFVIFLCTLPFFTTEDANLMKWHFMIYLIILFGFQSFLEWKYLKNSKQYVSTLILLIFGVIIMFNIGYFL